MKKKLLGLAIVAGLLMSSQAAMAAPASPVNLENSTKVVSASNQLEIYLNLKVGEGRQLSGSNFWVGAGADKIYLDIYGNLLALKAGMATVVADHPNGSTIVYYVTITN